MATALVLAAAACTNGTDEDNPEPTSVVEVDPGGDLYGLAESIEPGEPGQLIAVQEVDDLGIDARVVRVLYHSRSIQGDDIAVSGIVAIPKGEAPAGGRSVLSWAHGTTGIADECAPSKDPAGAGIGLVVPFLAVAVRTRSGWPRPSGAPGV